MNTLVFTENGLRLGRWDPNEIGIDDPENRFKLDYDT